MRAIRRITVLGAAAAVFGSIGMGAALADPSSTPSLDTLVGVNCPPLFDNGVPGGQAGTLVHDYNATNPTFPAACWDTVNPSTGVPGGTLTTKALNSGDTSCSLPRPFGSDGGIFELNQMQQDTHTVSGQSTIYCIDFAFSTRPPDTATTNDAFVSLAEDAIAWSYPVVSGHANPQPASLTRAQLVSIYTCADTNWSQVGGASAPIVPVLPQTNSGTRTAFLGDLGITATDEPCWVNGADSSGNPIEEDTGLSTGNTDVFNTATSENDIFPYSIGAYIAQGTAVKGTGTGTGAATVGGHANSTWGHGDLKLGEIVNPVTGTAEAPVTTNSSSQPVINPKWSPQFVPTLFDVVRNGGTATAPAFPTAPAYEATGLPAFIGPNGWVCTNVTGESDIVSYGFKLLGTNCGALSTGD